MVAKRRGKRKSSSKGFVFEVSDEDVSPDNSDSECNEPESKILKTDSTFVESVVNALSNLENETKTESIETHSSNNEISNSFMEPSENTDNSPNPLQNLEENFDKEIIDCSRPNANFDTPDIGQNQVEIEDGEVDNENVVNNNSPDHTIHINFSNENVSKLYKSRFLVFLSSFFELEVVKDDDLSITLKSDLYKWPILDETKDLNNTLQIESASSKKKKRKRNKKKELFVLDTTPAQYESTSAAKYMSRFNIDINEGNNEEKNKIHLSQVCFNCEQDHSLRDCPLPKDYAKINMMRQKFKKDKRQTSRYHLEEDQKYAHLTPGKISEKLRDALGLKPDQLPPYVYQMRMLGYPPGWLEEAKFVYSNLALFDSEGKRVIAKDKNKKQGLDTNKIIEYPGFNVPMQKGTKDEYRHYRTPAYSENCNKDAMIKYFEKEYSKQQDNLEVEDMILEVHEEIYEKVPTKASAIKDLVKSIPSPSLVDLETAKKNLLAALEGNIKSEENTDDAPISISSDTDKDDIPQIEDPDVILQESDVPLQCADEALSKIFDDKQETITKEVDLTPYQNQSNCTKAILNSSFGTPILKSSTPYSELPNPDNFMKDVSPVINFENLPNSTGKYEQMSGLLQKVRSTMKNFQRCNSS